MDAEMQWGTLTGGPWGLAMYDKEHQHQTGAGEGGDVVLSAAGGQSPRLCASFGCMTCGLARCL